ncbi:hypothetical protein CPB85DRAFT_1440654 [Mucidula mucida]|nr:hypothetical protein CPB85DRAFT_1440654 [Mucidula mucida]
MAANFQPVVAPADIRDIPPEIWNKIFLLSCDTGHPHVVSTGFPDSNRPRFDEPRVLELRRVCLSWRGVLALWQNVRINLGQVITPYNELRLSWLFDHSGKTFIRIHLHGPMAADNFPSIPWPRVRHLQMTSVDLDNNLWPHLRDALLAAVNLEEVDITGDLGTNKAFFIRTPWNAVIIQKSIQKLTLNSSAFLEGVRLPSLKELNIDMGFCVRAAPKQPTPSLLSLALFRSGCHLTKLSICQDTLPLHIADPSLTTLLVGLQSLVVDYEDNRLTPTGVDPQEYDDVVVAFADILRITSQNYILPALKDARLNIFVCSAYIRPRIRTIRAILAMLQSRVGRLTAFGTHGIHGHGGIVLANGTVTVLSKALPSVREVYDLIQFDEINVELTSNGQDILA